MNIGSLNSVIEALRENLQFNKLFISTSRRDHRIDKVIKLCREKNVVFQMVPEEAITRKAGEDHQGVYAELSPIRFYSIEEIVSNRKKGLILILDSITDTGNLGAIIRSAVAADVDGIIISLRNSAPINETVLKTSAGTLVKAKIVQSGNLSQDIKYLKENDFWVVGTVMERDKSIPYYKFDFTVNTAIVMGNEFKGVSPLLQKNSDQLVYIPHSEAIDSLNVSAAAAVLLFEALRQKG